MNSDIFIHQVLEYGSFDVQNNTKIMWTINAIHSLDLWITTIPKE
jgi:hypothetical protein